MRGYLAVTPDELAQLLNQGELAIETAFVPTKEFKSTNPDLGEEESEYILSLLAAEDSISFQDGIASHSFVLAVDLIAEQLGEELEVEINLTAPIKFTQIDCLFVGDANDNEGEMTWYAAQEIEIQLPKWLSA
jgi:hypothetical protein